MAKFPGEPSLRFHPYAGGTPGASSSAHQEESREEQAGRGPIQRVALIVGVTGVVGTNLANILSHPNVTGGPWKVCGLARTPKPDWLSYLELEYVQCDLLDRDDTFAKFSKLQDITHVFFVKWVSRDTEAENIADNGRLFQNTVDALLRHAKNLQHIVLQTGGNHYFGNWDLPQRILPHEAPFVEDVPRLPVDMFYYTQEDIIFETVKKKPGLTYSIHRPSVIFGFAPGNLINTVGTLVVYAIICKHEGMPLVYPGNQLTWDYLFDAADATLIAEHELWACLEPKAHNQAFNIANGDVFKWKQMWYLLGRKFGVAVREYSGTPVPLEEQMQGKEAVWDQIVRDNNLYPLRLAEIGHWRRADNILNIPVQYVHNVNKSKGLGFLEWRNSEKSFLRVIDHMRKYKLIPY